MQRSLLVALWHCIDAAFVAGGTVALHFDEPRNFKKMTWFL
jgi:hypothetical protein